MCASKHESDANITELKGQTASRRAASLSKDRAEYKKRSSSTGIKATAGLPGADSAHPHRAARVATRSLLAQGAIASSSDMPQLSMGCDGTRDPRMRKPSVSKSGKIAIENFDMGEAFIAAEPKQALQTAVDTRSINCTALLPGCEYANATTFDMNLDDCHAFPALSSMQAKVHPEIKKRQEAPAVTPEKSKQAEAGSESAEKEIEHQLGQDWVVVLPNDVSKPGSPSHVLPAQAFDGQHPRNIFTKKLASKQMASKEANEEADAPGMDWSQAGMPTDLMRRLIRASVNAAHRPQTEKKAAPLPMHVMRAQNLGSSNKRESSAPRTPRSQSKPRMIRQPLSRR